MRSSPLKSRGQSQPYVVTPTGSKALPKGQIRKTSPSRLEKLNERLGKSPYQSPYSTLSGEKSPTKFSPARVDTGESQDPREFQRLNERLNSCQKELQLTRTNFIESQNKLEKIIKDQKFYINELEMENLKVTKELSTVKSTSKKEYENLQEKDTKVIGDLQKKTKDFEEQSKFYIQENIKLKQYYEKEIFNLKTLIKDQDIKLEVYKREFSSFHTKIKKEQDETGFREEYIKKLQEGIKEKTKHTIELKQSNDQHLKFLEEKEQRILNLEKEIKKEKDINRMFSEKISDLMQDKINTQSETIGKTRKTEPNDKRSPIRQKSPVFVPAPEVKARDFELSLETSLKNARLSDIQPREESILKLRTHINDLEHKLNEISEENSKLRRENAQLVDKQIVPDEDLGRYRSLRQSPPKGLLMNLYKTDEEVKKMLNKIDQLSEKLEKANKKVTELQSKNEDLNLKLIDMINDNQRIQHNYQNLLMETEGKKNINREREKEKDKQKSNFIDELRNKVTERNKMIESLQELLRKERQNFERKWLEQEENHANEMQTILSSPTRKQQYSEEYSAEFSMESDKNLDELKDKIKELHGIINQLEKKSLDKDKENVQVLLKKSNEINELSVEKNNLYKKNLELNKKIDEVREENDELNRKIIETEEKIISLASENKDFTENAENLASAQIKSLEAELQSKDSVIKKLQFNIKSLENTIKSYQETVHNKDNLLEQSNLAKLELEKTIQTKIQELNDMKEVKLIKDDLLEQSNYIKLELENDIQKTLQELNNVKEAKAKDEKDKKQEIERKNLEIATLKTQVFLLEGRIKDISEENTKKKKSDGEISLLKEEKKKHEGSIKKINEGTNIKSPRDINDAKETESKNMRSLEVDKCDGFSIKNDMASQGCLEEQLKSANEEIYKLNDKLNQKTAELEMINIDLENSKSQLGQVTEDLNSKLLQSKQEFYAIKDSLTKLEGEAKSQETKLKLADMHKNQLQKTIKDLENDINSLKDDNYHLVKQLEEAENHEDTINIDLEIEKIQSSFEEQLKSANDEISNLKDKLNQKVAELVSINASLEKSKKQSEQANEELNSKLIQSKQEFYALKDTLTKLESEAKNQETKVKLADMHKNQLQKTIKDLENDINSLKDENYHLVKQLEEAESQEDFKESKSHEDTINIDLEIEKIRSSFEEQLKSANDEISNLKDKLSQKVSELVSIENSKKQSDQANEELNSKLIQSKQEFYALKDTLAKLESEAKSQETKLKLADMQKNQLQKTIKDLENDIKSLKDDNYHLVKQLEEAESQENSKEPEIIINYGSEASIFDKKESENELREHVSNLEEKIRLLQTQDKDKETQIEQIPQDTMEKIDIFIDNQKDLTQAIQALEDQNMKICKMLNEKTEEVKEISIKKCEFMQRINELSEENKKLHEENMAIITSNNELQIKIDNSHIETNELKNKIISLEKLQENQSNLIKQKENNYKQAMLEKRILDKKIDDLNKEILIIKDENVELIKEKENLEEINESLDKEMKEMEKLLDEMHKENSVKRHLISQNVVDEMESKWKKVENELRKEIEDKNAQIKDLESIVKDKIHMENIYKNDNVKKDMEIKEKDKEVKECKEACEKKILEVRQEILIVKENIKKVEKDFKEKDAQVKIADARRVKMQENIRELEDDLRRLREENYGLIVKGNQDSTENVSSVDLQEIGLEKENKMQEEIEFYRNKEQQFLQKIADFEGELTAVKEENDKIKLLVDDYQKQVQEKSTTIKRLQDSLSREQEQFKKIKNNKDTHTKELLIIKEDNINLIKEKEHLEDEIENLKNTLETLSESHQKSQASTPSLSFYQNQIQSLNTELAQKTIEIQSLNSQLHNLITEISTKTAELEQIRIEKFSAIQDLTQKCSKLESEIKDKDSKIKLIELHKGQLQKDLKNYEAELQALKEDNYLLVKKSESLEQNSMANSEDLRDNTEIIGKFMENESKLTKQIQDLQNEYKQSQELIRTLNKEKIEFSNRIKELEDCRSEIRQLTQEKENLLRNIKELSQNVDFLRKNNQADKENYEKEVNKQKKDLEMIKKQAKSRSDDDNIEKLHLKETNVQLITQNEKLEENIEIFKQKQEDYLEQISRYQSQITYLERQIIDFTEILKEKSLSLDALKEQNAKHLYQISNLEDENKHLVTQIQGKITDKKPEISDVDLLF
ncbi:hypothetical protein SteCoe_1351 [Stentor coeruleus]|uniref:Uncharacterized protein n=1 Tax=Stentor coeruleus TaxID=5963 RepID=A0A1R2D206_9CILI|nr:hypothetical protein SteCoe_1351 [Stentor coeruleus]